MAVPVSATFDLPGGESTAAALRRAEQERDQALADAARLRQRIHEAVDECQRRHAPYVSRCAQFDVWSKWARECFEREGDRFWGMTSEANRLVILSIIEERDLARAELASARQERDQALAKRDQAIENSEYWMRIAQAARAELESARQELGAIRRREAGAS
jgi:hypothetical protein